MNALSDIVLDLEDRARMMDGMGEQYHIPLYDCMKCFNGDTMLTQLSLLMSSVSIKLRILSCTFNVII